MRKPSLFLLGLAVLAIFLADFEIAGSEPWGEISKMLVGAISPKLNFETGFLQALANTLIFALVGTFLGGLVGGFFAFLYSYKLVRITSAFLRSIHEIFWAFLLLPIFGLTPLCGVFAIAIPFAGIFAKIFAEMVEEANQEANNALPESTGTIERFSYALLPQLWKELKHYTSYRFECALRSSAILGFIGLPTLGYHLETWFREGDYSEAFFLLYLFYFLIATLKLWAKPAWVPLWVGLGVWFLPKQTHFSWENLHRFLTVDIIPWPLRVTNGQGEGWEGLLPWLQKLWLEQAWEGITQTLILSQIALVGSGILGLMLFPVTSKRFANPFVKPLGHLFLVVLRTTPEYLLAYVLIHLFGPSMLPAALALALHNGGILGHLASKRSEQIPIELGLSKKRINRYFYEVLPRIYGQYFAFLLYRWEVILRESAILGILGIYTLGFFIDSAFAFQRMDEAVILILIGAALNLTVGQIGQKLRNVKH